ncbi:MAG: pyruvate carboxylase subunit B [Dehalococcoidia bacterium]|jgi:pyruvate carboxylase subunit B|nr:pyruvate carboxylase subunit B [Dehalococcoidia bacterium]
MYEPTAVKITDLTLRDGHQSLLATRVRTQDLLDLVPGMDALGFWSLEVWGGATFDVMTRFLNEDPWERLRLIKRAAPKTPLQMLLRGQNLVGYRNYADDVVKAFVRHAADNGVDVFRIFDALNDERNLRTAMEAAKQCGKHVQAAVCYSLTEQKLGGPVYTTEYFVQKALTLQEMGADSICVKDMAGLMAPDDAYDLVFSLKEALDVPVALHSHSTSGMAAMSFLKAIEAGVDIIDTCLAPFALRTSHTAVETMIAALSGTPRDTGLDLDSILKLDERLEAIAPKYRDYLAQTRFSVIDTAVLRHQIPGGMYSNMVAQLKEANALGRLAEVYDELPRTRKDLGYPPLVTPTSQIVGTQAVSNVLFGRYKAVSEQVKAYAYGLYGRPPAPIDPAVQALVLKGYERGEQPITVRPADVIEPEMEAARREVGELAADDGDVLTYVLYPTSGKRFLRWKYGLETPPAETKGKSIEDIRREDELFEQVRNGKAAAAPAAHGPAAAAPKPSAGKVAGTPLLSPMPGTIIRFLVVEGDEVHAGDGVCVLEAMKMENILPSPEDGRVLAIKAQPGERVQLNQILAVIG